ncbi:MAG: twin-arginine translocase TatA/TatE family subunit [Deltaproteobacteria bacterium]|nr:twin-arginine translocase TatA/TatE family subunit [Deltaproteobacteria bacterium]
MFGIGMDEVFLVGLVSLFAVGPKQIPGAARALAKTLTELRRTANTFRDALHEELGNREELRGLHQFRQSIEDELHKARTGVRRMVENEIGNDLKQGVAPIRQELQAGREELERFRQEAVEGVSREAALPHIAPANTPTMAKSQTKAKVKPKTTAKTRKTPSKKATKATARPSGKPKKPSTKPHLPKA